ncbi:MAG: bifunctional [glutamate--ammonia ligase]-adenylyl-L-tyrosine phosphorylase/[glutamate--ammonia-ligase] adenylyltransferase [Gammaproteobacteria bacterium]
MRPEDFPAQLRDAAHHAFSCSDFVAESFARDPLLWPDLARSDALMHLRAAGGEACWPEGRPPDPAAPEPEWQAWLRRWRRREMVRIAWRDLTGLASLEETLADLSAFADDAIALALRQATALTAARYGEPVYADGEPMPLVVVAMGKLGGRELNFSSDIDLVFLFPGHGETQHAVPVTHDEFFLRLGQALIRLLAAVTPDGFVFRVDMRLRPFGDSGPLACSFASFEDYLLQHGRDWERYAWIKARAVTGAETYVDLYGEAVRPFVFRRYLDFGVFESLREMKALIEKQVARRDLVDHLKLGPGGIREIEFIVQAMQLIRGGQDRRLQNPRLLEVLPLLGRQRLLRPQSVQELEVAYRFLRTLENRLQMLRDAQVHTLPSDDASRGKLARAMGVADWAALRHELDGHLRRVQREFQSLVFSPAGEAAEASQASGHAPGGASAPSAEPSAAPSLSAIWDDTLGLDGLRELLAARGLLPAADLARLLLDFREGSLPRRLDAVGLRRLQSLLPSLIGALDPGDDALTMTRRMLRVLEAIGGRSSYFALLVENPAARRRFVAVCRGGDFLVTQLAAHPLLLDELLDERTITEPPGRAELAADLEDRLARIPGDDPEHLVDVLAQFKHAAVFRVAIADLTGRLPLMRVSDRLTDIAELVVDKALQQALAQMTAQFGTPTWRVQEDGAPRAVQVCAIGYGKLGGIELGYGSDLDLVFLHDSRGPVQETDAARPIDNQIFFVRFAQRIVHILTVQSRAGRLYEVDTRLRPSGKGGMLVTGIDAFGDYQRGEAWTWEHQALLHARAVAGAPALRADFELLRLGVLTHHVRRDGLQDEVRDMRERMRRELDRSGTAGFDLKQGRGGVADIEFLAQHWALREAGRHPAVAMFSDTIRQLETLASGDLVPQTTVDVLTGAYRRYRARAHQRALRGEGAVVDGSEFRAERAAVAAVWDAAFPAAGTGGV